MIRLGYAAMLGILLGPGCFSPDVSSSERPELPRSSLPVTNKMVPVDQAKGGPGGVCFLKVNRRIGSLLKQDGSATGALVDGRFVITAAHNIVDAPYPLGRVDTIEVAVGEVHAGEGSSIVPPKDYWSLAPRFRWRPKTIGDPRGSSFMIQHDYGFVDLGEELKVGNSFELGAPHSLKVGDIIKVAGYPEGGARVHGANGKRLFQASGKITAVTANLFSYDVVTARGMSGAPVWVERGGRRILVGVHVGSDFGGEKGAVARRVDSALICDWNRWKSLRASED